VLLIVGITILCETISGIFSRNVDIILYLKMHSSGSTGVFNRAGTAFFKNKFTISFVLFSFYDGGGRRLILEESVRTRPVEPELGRRRQSRRKIAP